MNTRLFTAGVLGAIAIALGAFGAHALKARLGEIPEATSWWNTATQYLLIHAVAIGAIPSVRSAFLWSVGAVIFSSTLYGLALGGPHWLGAITPLGGIALIIGWLGLIGEARRI